jgi:hypothetical protein
MGGRGRGKGKSGKGACQKQPPGVPSIGGHESTGSSQGNYQGSQPRHQASAPVVCPSFACPLSCGAGPWATRDQCFSHLDRLHPLDESLGQTLQPWLLSARRRICGWCCTMTPVRGKCRKCKRLPEDVSQGATPDLCPELTDILTAPDDVQNLLLVLINALPVLRGIPGPARGEWPSGLASELEKNAPDRPAANITRPAVFCWVILAPLERGGKRHTKQSVAVLKHRLVRWSAGQAGSLIREYAQEALAPRPPRDQTIGASDLLPDTIRRAALRAVRDGAIAKAAHMLAEKLHPVPADCQTALQALHPSAEAPALPSGTFSVGDDFSLEEVGEALSSFAPGSSGGFSGLMPDHTKGAESPAHSVVLGHLARICCAFAWGRFPAEHAASLSGARLIPTGKNGGQGFSRIKDGQ